MGNINKVILIGSVVKKPIINISRNSKVVYFKVVTSETWNKGNVDVEKLQFHRIAVYGNKAQYLADNLKDGSRVFIEGKLTYITKVDEFGEEQEITSIIANDVQELDNAHKGDDYGF